MLDWLVSSGNLAIKRWIGGVRWSGKLVSGWYFNLLFLVVAFLSRVGGC